MVLVPPFVEVDGFVVPLQCYEATPQNGYRASIGHADVSRDSALAGFRYVVGTLLMADPRESLRALEMRQDLSLPQELYALHLSVDEANAGEYAKHARNWEELTGAPADLRDVYDVGTSFSRKDLVIPRSSFLRLMTKLYELNEAVREGRMEPRIDESIPLPPPRPPPPPPKWTDEELQELEDRAAQLDELDPLTDDLSDSRIAKKAEWHRSYLLEMLNFAYKRGRDGVDDALLRLTSLELPVLQRYQEAFEELSAYLRAPERAAIVEPTIEAAKREAKVTEAATCAERAAAEGLEVTPYTADVSIDLFRLPEAARPDGVSRTEWLARCEAVFLYDRIRGMAAGGDSAGDVFTRILGHRVRLRYRPEVTPTLRLWRVELI